MTTPAGSRFAAIDIGTNTILLLIVELKADGSFEVLEDRAAIPRLGEGVDRTGQVSPAGAARGLAVLRGYRERCVAAGVEEIRVVATSALRDAGNRESFSRLVEREFGFSLDILSGDEEAFYSYLAVRRGLPTHGGVGEILVVDVGGGSTEIIWGRDDDLIRRTSLDLGAVRLTERLLHSDPATEEQCRRLVETVDARLRQGLGDWPRPATFQASVGVAGTFTTLAAMEIGLARYSHGEVHGRRLTLASVRREIARLKGSTVAEIKKIPGLEPERADVILAGAFIVERVMTFFALTEAIVSDQGIRYGLLHEKLRGTPWKRAAL
jgi:exopolyphosphatase/guanosine-5'-triphosphate,3'-diphosphate pyrophosphatase